jgi:2Fe-2S ferredoxin
MIVNCITPAGETLRLEGTIDQSLMSLLCRHQAGVEAICGGAMSCGTCHVHVDQAWLGRLPPPDEGEEAMLDCLDDRRADSRLSCQIVLKPELDGLSVVVAPNA